MKAKKIISEKCEQPKPPLAPLIEESEDQLAPWQKEVIALARARLSINGEHDVVHLMHRRASALCRIVEDMASGNTESEPSLDALRLVMDVVQEDIHVAQWITAGRSNASLYR